MIEVEIRGPLAGPEAEKFKAYLEQHATDKIKYQDVAIFCDTAHLKNFGSFANARARIQANFRRFADGQTTHRIKLKLSDPSAHGRREYDMPIEGTGLPGFFEILKRFGVTQASFRDCERWEYTVNGYEVSLKHGHVVGDHYEIETTCFNESDIEGTKDKLAEFVSEFGLAVWEPDEYRQVILGTINEAPYIDFAEGVKKFNIK